MTRSLDIIWFAQQSWDRCWTAKQQLTTRLGERGHHVLYVDPQASDDLAVEQEIAPRVWRLAGERDGDGRLARSVARHTRPMKAARRLGFKRPTVIVARPQAPRLHRILHPDRLVYYACDEWTAFDGLTPTQRQTYRRNENALVREADLAIGVSPRLARRFASLSTPTRVLENAADGALAPEKLAQASPHPALAELSHPRLLYMGQIDRRLDVALLGELARRRPAWSFVFAGRVAPGVDVAPLTALPNVHLLGFVEHDQLAGVLRDTHVCLAPYRLTALTQACCPAKVYEYLGTGLPTVASPVDGLTLDETLVRRAVGAEQWIAQIEAALRDDGDSRKRRLQAAGKLNWDRQTDTLERWLLAIQRLPRQRRPAATLDPHERAERQMRHIPDGERRRYALHRTATRLASLTGRRSRDPRRVLVVRYGAMGDLIACLPMLRALRRGLPDAHLTVGVGSLPVAKAVLGEPGLVDEILDLRPLRASPRRDRLRAEWELVRRRFDTVIGTESYFQAPNALRCGAGRRIAFADDHPVTSLSNEHVHADPNRHEAENLLHLAAAAGGFAEEADRVPHLTAESTESPPWPVTTEQLGLDAEMPVLAVHPGSKRPTRRWPTDRFADLITQTLRRNPTMQAAITGVPDEADLAAEIRHGVPMDLRPRVIDLCGGTTMDQLKQLLGAAAACVSNDTGVMHLARSIGTPLLALLGPENDARWGPHPLGTGPAIAIRHIVPCAPCHRWRCGEHYCMRALPVEQAVAALDDLLQHEGAGALPLAGLATGVYPLERRAVRHGWTGLQVGGRPVPSVTAAVFVPETAQAESLERTLTSLWAQDYPAFRPAALLVGAAAPALPGLEPSLIIRRDTPEHAWAALSERCGDDWLIGIPAGHELPAGALGRRVAVLVRSPDAIAAGPHDVRHADDDHLTSPWNDGRLRRPTVCLDARDPAPEPLHAPTPELCS